MATDREFVDMVEFIKKHKVIPVVDSIFPLAEANHAIDRMNQGKQFGKIILSI